MQTQPAVPKPGKLFPADPLAGKDTRQDEIENGSAVIHTAGGDTEDGDQCGVRSVECGIFNYGIRHIGS